MVADFRVTCPEGRFCANFTRLAPPGLGLTITLPRLIGAQQAEMMFYTGDRIPGDKAVQMGLASLLVSLAEVRRAAIDLAIVSRSRRHSLSGPPASRCVAVSPTPSKRRGPRVVEQEWLFRTRDFREGVREMAAREIPDSKGARPPVNRSMATHPPHRYCGPGGSDSTISSSASKSRPGALLYETRYPSAISRAKASGSVSIG